MQKIKIDYVHCPMRKFWRTSLRPVGQNNVGIFSSCEQRPLLSWSIARRGVCAQITCQKLVLESASCNLKRKQEVTAKQKLCSENKGELKNPAVYIVFSRRRKESSVGEKTTWSGRLFQTGIVKGKKENL